MNEIVTQEKNNTAVMEMTPQDVRRQVNLIQQVMAEAMTKDEHYGIIPGCGNKPTLLKAGAEKLSLTFRLAPSYDIKEKELQSGHREYVITCTITHINTGKIYGQGVGSCSTMESKYRFRTGPKEITDKEVPKAYWDLRKTDPNKAAELIGKGNGTAKDESGIWRVTTGGGSKVENENPADQYNTVLKMAKKRAYVDGMLTATAASDIFTQDIEEIVENEKIVTNKVEIINLDKSKEVKQEVNQPEKPIDASNELPKQIDGRTHTIQQIAVKFEKCAKNTPLPKENYKECCLNFCASVNDLKDVISSEFFTQEQLSKAHRILTCETRKADNFISQYLDSLQAVAEGESNHGA